MGLGAAGGLGGLGPMNMGGFNGFMSAGFGQTTPAYDFVPFWLTESQKTTTTTPLPLTNEDEVSTVNPTVSDDKANNNIPTTAPSLPPSGSGGTQAPWDSDAAWNGVDGGGGGQSGGGGFIIYRLPLH